MGKAVKQSAELSPVDKILARLREGVLVNVKAESAAVKKSESELNRLRACRESYKLEIEDLEITIPRLQRGVLDSIGGDSEEDKKVRLAEASSKMDQAKVFLKLVESEIPQAEAHLKEQRQTLTQQIRVSFEQIHRDFEEHFDQLLSGAMDLGDAWVSATGTFLREIGVAVPGAIGAFSGHAGIRHLGRKNPRIRRFANRKE